MKLAIIRIEEQVVTCEFEDGSLIDIGRQWITKDISVGQVIEFEYYNKA